MHDIISDSRHALQVELRVSRLLTTPVASSGVVPGAPGVGVGVTPMGRPPLAAGRIGARTPMATAGPSSGTRIQVGQTVTNEDPSSDTGKSISSLVLTISILLLGTYIMQFRREPIKT